MKISPVWRKAGKQAVLSFCAVIITNMADPTSVTFTWPWFRHLLIAMFFLTFFNEAQYWKNWASTEDPSD
jgi:hypothetical protein